MTDPRNATQTERGFARLLADVSTRPGLYKLIIANAYATPSDLATYLDALLEVAYLRGVSDQVQTETDQRLDNLMRSIQCAAALDQVDADLTRKMGA